jgi:hypothetical protein
MRYHKDGMEARQVDVFDYDRLCSLVAWTKGRAVDDDHVGIDLSTADGGMVIELSTADGRDAYARHRDWVIRAKDGRFHVYKHADWRPIVDGWPLLTGP